MDYRKYLNLYRDWAKGVSDRHSNLDFVQRYMNPVGQPKIDNPDGSISTHLMSWSDGDPGDYYVHPTLQRSQSDPRRLEPLGPRERPRESILFHEPNQADLFSKIYKTYPRPQGSLDDELNAYELLRKVLQSYGKR